MATPASGMLRLTISSDKTLAIGLACQGTRLLGISRVEVNGVPLRNPDRPIAPLIATPDGYVYNEFRVLDIKRRDRQTVVKSAAIGRRARRVDEWSDHLWNRAIITRNLPETVEDELHWTFEPCRETIDGLEYQGFGYGYRFVSRTRRIRRIIDFATWELGGKAAGNTIIAQNGTAPPVHRATLDSDYTTEWIFYNDSPRSNAGGDGSRRGARAARSEHGGLPGTKDRLIVQLVPRLALMQGFDFQFGRDGSLLIYYDKPGRILTMTRKHAGENVINYVDDVSLPLANRFSTPMKRVLFAKADKPLSQVDGANLWTRCCDHVHDAYRARLGLKEDQVAPIFHIMPWAGRSMFGGESVSPDVARRKAGRLLKDYAGITLPFFRSLGFRRFFCGPHWRSDCTEAHGSPGGNECCVHLFELAPQYGGEAALKRLCDAANRLGMEVIAWISMHMSSRSALLREHPEWKVKHRDGDEFPGVPVLHPMSLHSGFRKYVLDSLRRTRKKTGLHGVMFDSYHTEGGMYAINYADPLLRPQADELFRLQAALQRAGFVNTTEAVGPFGVSTWGFCTRDDARHHNLLQWYFGNEFAAYKTSYGAGFDGIANGTITADQYYRFAANKCLLCLGVNTVAWKFNAKKTNREVARVFTEPFRQTNHDFNEVSRWLHRRTLLDGDRGVEWAGREGKVAVLFSFCQFDHVLPREAFVTDVTGGCDIGAVTSIPARKNHTYIIRWRTR